MGKCGCSQQGLCTCHFEDTSTVEWSGTGSTSLPFAGTAVPLVQGGETSTLSVNVEVAGDEMIISANPASEITASVFTADGSWSAPVGASFVRILMIGGGGGGASGRSSSVATAKGGGGGDAGGVVAITGPASAFPGVIAVTIGQGGSGGAGVVNGIGNNGTAGGSTSFGTRVVPGGAGGRTEGQAPVHLAAGMPPGQRAVAWDEVFTAAHPYLAPGAGGVGEGAQYSASPGGYSLPGQGERYPANTGGGPVSGHGRDEPVMKMGGGGGGGLEQQAGGNGGLYGGGGGGGGFSSNAAVSSGAGGAGADGLVVVVAW